MLQLVVPLSNEGWDEEKEEFVEAKNKVLQLEHSLISLSKWESKWNKPFLSQKEMTAEETMDYIKFMTITPNVSDDVYNHLTRENIDDVVKYINAPMTATTVSDDRTPKGKREIVTSELIYYWMITLQIPSHFDKWHLNRLMTLIRVCNVKNQPPDKKKANKRDIMSRNAALNAARRKQLNSRG